jgi:hypothetical protein
MSVIPLKDFSDDLHRALKIKAAETGTTIKGLKRDKGKKKGG